MVSRLAVASLAAYKCVISPYLPRSCRFYPTCSEYAAQAIADHGLGRGILLAARRLLRCHPLHPGGYDPPPARAALAPGSGDRAPRECA